MKTKQTTMEDFVLPQAWISVGRNRQKIYKSKDLESVYLQDGQEFQIELFNPTPTKYLVKIKINGSYYSSRGLILNPGQRYFLDRFIDENRKLTFSVYDVENTDEVKKAIEKNGLLEVEFYEESLRQDWCNGYYPYQPYSQPIWQIPCTPYNPYNPFQIYNSNSSGTVGYQTTFDYSASNCTSDICFSSETGRVEMGEKSSQKFSDGHGNFNTFVTNTTKVQIIPLSQKAVESQEIRTYCTGCGSRMKKQSWKFCPNCGTKID